MKVYFLQQRSSRATRWETIEASLDRYQLDSLKNKRESYLHPKMKLRIVMVNVQVPSQ